MSAGSPATTGDVQPDELRAQLVGALIDTGHVRSPQVARVLRVVPRHRFLPGVSLAEAYEDTHVVTKWATDGSGRALSSASAPWIVADMLEDLDLQPRHRVLEIGAGTGYNAALLAELVGPTGSVTTIDIDPEVTADAETNLASTGFSRIRVVTGDGAAGYPLGAPFDRIIATVGCWDIPAAWWDQLTGDGRLVLPLRWRGDSRIVAFARTGSLMTADAIRMGGFIPMREHDGEEVFTVADGAATVRCDPDQPITSEALTGVFEQARTETWSGVTVGDNESWDVVWLRMASYEPGACRLTTTQGAIEAGHVPADLLTWTHALVSQDSLAYLTIRPAAGTDGRFELGAAGYGRAGHRLAERIRIHIHNWDPDRTATPTITAHRARTEPDPAYPAIPKPSGHLIIREPAPVLNTATPE